MADAPVSTILIASDNIGDAALVKKLLADAFGKIFLSIDLDKAADDFVRNPPDVLILAFDTLEKAQHYCLTLFRICTAVHQHLHRTIILCSKDDV